MLRRLTDAACSIASTTECSSCAPSEAGGSVILEAFQVAERSTLLGSEVLATVGGAPAALRRWARAPVARVRPMWSPGWWNDLVDEGAAPDPRFTFANERTFLAWIRTSLALIAGGLGVDAFAHDLPAWSRTALASVL